MPDAAALLSDLQQRHTPPWKTVGGTPSSSGSRARSEAAKERQRSSIEEATGKGLVDGAAAVDGAASGAAGYAYA
jgi:hypothetical protein